MWYLPSAFGAVGIAAVGVYSSFHFAAWAIAQNSQEKTEKRCEAFQNEDNCSCDVSISQDTSFKANVGFVLPRVESPDVE